MTLLSLATVAPAVALTSVAADLGMDYVQKGYFLGAAFWGITLFILISGPLADRVGFRVLLLGGTALYSVGCLLTAQAGGQWTASMGVFAIGAAAGLSDALFTPIICAIFPRDRTRMSNLLHSFYAIGIIITVALMLLLMRVGCSWRNIFRILAVLPVPFLVAMALLPLPDRAHEGPKRLRTRDILHRRAFIGFALAIFLIGVTELGPAGWLPNLVEEAAAGSRTHGALGMLVFAAALAGGRLSGSWVIHKLGVRGLFIAGTVLSAVSLLLAALPVSSAFTIFWLSVLAFGVASLWPTILGAAGDRFPQAGASMFSLLMTCGNFGGVVGPILVGAVAEAGSLYAAMGLLGIVPLGALASILLLVRPAKRHESARE